MGELNNKLVRREQLQTVLSNFKDKLGDFLYGENWEFSQYESFNAFVESVYNEGSYPKTGDRILYNGTLAYFVLYSDETQIAFISTVFLNIISFYKSNDSWITDNDFITTYSSVLSLLDSLPKKYSAITSNNFSKIKVGDFINNQFVINVSSTSIDICNNFLTGKIRRYTLNDEGVPKLESESTNKNTNAFLIAPRVTNPSITSLNYDNLHFGSSVGVNGAVVSSPITTNYKSVLNKNDLTIYTKNSDSEGNISILKENYRIPKVMESTSTVNEANTGDSFENGIALKHGSMAIILKYDRTTNKLSYTNYFNNVEGSTETLVTNNSKLKTYGRVSTDNFYDIKPGDYINNNGLVLSTGPYSIFYNSGVGEFEEAHFNSQSNFVEHNFYSVPRKVATTDTTNFIPDVGESCRPGNIICGSNWSEYGITLGLDFNNFNYGYSIVGRTIRKYNLSTKGDIQEYHAISSHCTINSDNFNSIKTGDFVSYGQVVSAGMNNLYISDGLGTTRNLQLNEDNTISTKTYTVTDLVGIVSLSTSGWDYANTGHGYCIYNIRSNKLEKGVIIAKTNTDVIGDPISISISGRLIEKNIWDKTTDTIKTERYYVHRNFTQEQILNGEVPFSEVFPGDSIEGCTVINVSSTTIAIYYNFGLIVFTKNGSVITAINKSFADSAFK